jgi:ribosome biogenesis protein MAK21
MNNLLIGPEILSLAEVDVPPEDLVFHKFYVNKMNSSKKPKKKKKKAAEEESGEDLYEVEGGVDGGDESDNEEIENMLDSTNLSFEADGDYDYDDLDQVANEDDEDLVGNVSDAETDAPSDVADGEDFDIAAADDLSDEDVDIDTGDADDGIDDENENEIFEQRKRKRKSGGKAAASPFASLEDYEHLLNEDGAAKEQSTKRKPSKSRKKRKSSD